MYLTAVSSIILLKNIMAVLPVLIKAVPEGTVVPVNNAVDDHREYRSRNVSGYQTSSKRLLMQVWYPCTVATVSREVRKIVEEYFEETAARCFTTRR